ncbi:MAG: hypothetical protein WA932_08405, partial [Nitrososphaeraceae archaeon]
LGYIFAGFNILVGFILIAYGLFLGSQSSSTWSSDSMWMFIQMGSIALVYGGFGTIVLGVLLIWGLVKSGQLESIDKNIKIIAEWAKSQQQKERQDVQTTSDDLKPIADSEKKSFVENGVRYTKD